MINTNELRLGNKVLYRGEIDTVIEIGIGNGYCRNNGYFNDDKGYVEPVALSPEILQACGFDNREGYLWFLNDDFYVHFRDGSLVYNGLPDGAPTLRNLHQLQNLYFALTGTELTINLEKVKV